LARKKNGTPCPSGKGISEIDRGIGYTNPAPLANQRFCKKFPNLFAFHIKRNKFDRETKLVRICTREKDKYLLDQNKNKIAKQYWIFSEILNN